MNEQNVVYLLIEYYSAIKRIEIPKYATMWMNFENITVSERSQPSKATYYMIPLTQSIQDRKSMETEISDQKKGMEND